MKSAIEHESLMSLAKAPLPGPFITAVSGALAGGIADDELRLVLIRRLAEQGLAHRAAEVAAGCSLQLQANAEFARMRDNLQSVMPGGEVGWTEVAKTFERNLAALRKRVDWTDALVDVWSRERERIELHRTRDGVFQVFDRRDPSNERWRPVFGDPVPKPTAAELAEALKNQILSPIVLEGVGLGYHLPWLYAATRDTFLGATPVIYHIESSFAAAAVAMHLNDWIEPLSDPRVRLCCGPDAYDSFERMAAGDPNNLPPQMIVRAPSWTTRDEALGERVNALARRFEAKRSALCDELNAAFHDRDRQWWRRRYETALAGEGRPLRVLGVTCRFSTVLQYSMRDMLQAFRENGCETRLLIEPNDHLRTTPITMLHTIREFDPDLVVIIDHTRAGQAPGLADNTPLLTWVQDRMPKLFSREAGASIGPLDFCMGFARDELVNRCGYPAARFMPCEMATDQAAFFEPDADPEEVIRSRHDEVDPQFACDVAFATTHSKTPDATHQEYRVKCAPAIVAFLDAAYEELVALAKRCELNGGLMMPQFVRRIEAATGFELSDEQRGAAADEYVRPIVDKILRHQTVEWAAEWAERSGRRLHLYGNGWDEHPRFARYARGFVTHGSELGRAFRAAKVNLHAGCNRALHQRVLDGLASGGFFLIRRHADDIQHRLWRAMYDMALSGDIKPGDTLAWDDYPESLRDELIAIRKMRGVDPYVSVEITEASIDQIRRIHESSDVLTPAAIWPDIDQVTFGAREEMFERLEAFVGDDELRRATAKSMRESMLGVFSYRSLAGKLLRWAPGALQASG